MASNLARAPPPKRVMNPGYFYISRKLLKHPMWTSERFTRGQAWIDLIGLANHTPSEFRIAGELIKVQRGQCAWSIISLSERWGWNRKTTSRFLDWLEDGQFVSQNRGIRTSIITICKYEEYQTHDFTEGTTEGTSKGTTDGTTEGTHKRKDKEKIKKDNKEPPTPKSELFTEAEVPRQIRLPEWLPADIWQRFREHRLKKKAPLTLYAEELAIAAVANLREQGYDPTAVINHVILSNWAGIFPPDRDKKIKEKPQQRPIRAGAKNVCQ